GTGRADVPVRGAPGGKATTQTFRATELRTLRPGHLVGSVGEGAQDVGDRPPRGEEPRGFTAQHGKVDPAQGGFLSTQVLAGPVHITRGVPGTVQWIGFGRAQQGVVDRHDHLAPTVVPDTDVLAGPTLGLGQRGRHLAQVDQLVVAADPKLGHDSTPESFRSTGPDLWRKHQPPPRSRVGEGSNLDRYGPHAY